MTTISIAEDFSKNPAGRFANDGPNSGQKFRDTYLVPQLKKEQEVIIVLDGTRGYGSSFLEEAFGGLVRGGHITKEDIGKKLIVKALSPSFSNYQKLAEKYMREALARVK